MAENLVQTQDQVELYFETWGSRSTYAIAILRDFSIVDPRKLNYSLQRGVEKEIILPNGVKVIAVQNNSRKNAHKSVKLSRNDVLAVYHYATRREPQVQVIAEDIVSAAEVKVREETEEKMQGNKKLINMYDVTYVVLHLKDGEVKEVEVERTYKRTLTELIGRPNVEIYVRHVEFYNVVPVDKEAFKQFRIIAKGDTFHVKETLKALGFKWNSSWSHWEIVVHESKLKETLNSIVQKLNEVADVTVEG